MKNQDLNLGTAFMCQRKEEEKSASATCVNEAARKHCKTLAVCNLPHTVIKAIEGKQQASLFHQGLVRAIKKVWYRRD